MNNPCSRETFECATLSCENDDMPFPDSQRIIYAQNPLDEVICQLRFPPILKIETEVPAAFQEALRKEYPLFQQQKAALQAPALPEQISQMLASLIPQPAAKAYEFSSADERWKVTLSRDFLALTCSRYERWEDFKAHLATAEEALLNLYAPAFFVRIGLRYRNVILRSKLGLKDASWRELLQPQVAGLLNSEIAAEIDGVGNQISLRLQQYEAQVTIQHGTAKVQDTQEECYYIDADFSTNRKTNIAEANDILDFFNRQSGKLFRWFISDRLHRAMEPAAVA